MNLLTLFIILSLNSLKIHQKFLKRNIIVRKKIFQNVERPFLKEHPILRKIISSKGKFPDTAYIYILAIRVNFQKEDPDDPLTTGDGIIKLTSNGEDSILPNGEYNPFYEPPHTKSYFEAQLEALANYWKSVSFGKIKIMYKVLPEGETEAYTLPFPMKYYGDTARWGKGLCALIQDAIYAADRDTQANIDFDDLNENGVPDYMEGIYDTYIIFHAGSAWQTDINGDSPFDLPAVYVPAGALWYYLGEPYIIANEGKDTIWEAAVMPEEMSQDGYIYKLSGVLAHEFAHILYFPDLYDYNYESSGIGGWGLMSTGVYLYSQNIPPGTLPPYPSAFSRIFLDSILNEVWGVRYLNDSNFLDMNIQDLNDTLTLSLKYSGVKMNQEGKIDTSEINNLRFVRIWISPDQYFLIENRTKDYNRNNKVDLEWKCGTVVNAGGEYDYLLPGEGILIWHVDQKLVEERYIDNELEKQPVLAVDLEEADRVQDLQKYRDYSEEEFYGWWQDPYFQGNNTLFGVNTFPNSSFNYGGISGFNIEIESPRDTIMKVKIWQNIEIKGFPKIIENLSPEKKAKKCFLATSSDTLVYMTMWFVDSFQDPNGYWTYTSKIKIFKLENGKPLRLLTKTVDFNYGYPNFSLPFANSKGFFISILDTLYKFQTENGKTSIVKIPLNSTGISAISGFKNKIFIGTKEGFIKCIDIEKDTILWQTFLGFPVKNNFAFLDTNFIFYNAEGKIYKINVSNGKIESVWGKEAIPSDKLNGIAIADINRDGKKEFITIWADGIKVFDENGKVLWKFILKYGEESRTWGSPVISDINEDGYGEVIFTYNSKLFALNHNGTLVSGYPIDLKDSSLYSLVVADTFLIVSGKKLYILNYNGKILAEYGQDLTYPAFICDFDKDGLYEVLTLTRSLYLHCYDFNFKKPIWKNFGADSLYSFYIPDSFFFGRIPAYEYFDIKRIYVYPNPACGDKITLRFYPTKKSKLNIKLFDYSGGLIKESLKEKEFDGGKYSEYEIDISELPKGLYILRCEFSFGVDKIVKFVKFAKVPEKQ